jgi:hypothetical protein
MGSSARIRPIFHSLTPGYQCAEKRQWHESRDGTFELSKSSDLRVTTALIDTFFAIAAQPFSETASKDASVA